MTHQGVDVGELLGRTRSRANNAHAFTAAYRLAVDTTDDALVEAGIAWWTVLSATPPRVS